jgi:hypothetical protein
VNWFSAWRLGALGEFLFITLLWFTKPSERVVKFYVVYKALCWDDYILQELIQFSKSVNDTASTTKFVQNSMRNVWVIARSVHFLSDGWPEESNEIFGQFDSVSRTRNGQRPIWIYGTECWFNNVRTTELIRTKILWWR